MVLVLLYLTSAFNTVDHILLWRLEHVVGLKDLNHVFQRGLAMGQYSSSSAPLAITKHSHFE